jgi:hypothetical protein
MGADPKQVALSEVLAVLIEYEQVVEQVMADEGFDPFNVAV